MKKTLSTLLLLAVIISGANAYGAALVIPDRTTDLRDMPAAVCTDQYLKGSAGAYICADAATAETDPVYAAAVLPVEVSTTPYTVLPGNVNKTHKLNVQATIDLPMTGFVAGDRLTFISQGDQGFVHTFVSDGGTTYMKTGTGDTLSFVTPGDPGESYVFQFTDQWVLIDAFDLKYAYQSDKHTQGTDQALDTGGANEVTAATLRTLADNTSGTNTGDQSSVSGSAGSLAAQYIDWSAGSGGASIANKPDLTTYAPLASPAFTGNPSITGTLGADSIVNGTFDADSNWTKGTNWTIAAGVASKAAGSATTLAETASTVVAGKYYKLTFDVPTLSASTITPSAGGWTGAAISTAATGIANYFYATTTGAVTFTATATTVGTVDNVILQEVSSTATFDDVAITSASDDPIIFKKVLNKATGNQAAFHLAYQTNKAMSGNDTGLLIDMLDTASPGTSNLIDLWVGGNSKFKVSSAALLSLSSISIDGPNSTIQMTHATQNYLRAVTSGFTFHTYYNPAAANNGWTFTHSNTGYANTSGASNYVEIKPKYNQASGTASNTDLLINRTETAVGSGAQLLIDAQVGSVSKFKIDNTGKATAAQYRLSALNTAPANASDTGTLGEIRIDASYIYVCTATNTWVRAALATW